MAAAIVQTPVAGPLGQPDIAYGPDLIKFQARTQRRQQNEALSAQLPQGFPPRLESELVWDGLSVSKDYQWSRELTAEETKEVEDALRHFQGLEKPLGQLTAKDFPLPNLHATLRDISQEIHNGHGFKVLRGIPVDKYSREENVIIYTGIASHVAPTRGRQDNMYNDKPADVVLAHIKDLSGNEATDKMIGSPAYTAEKQVFHTDSGDVIALFALASSETGGESYLASTWHVYNELAKTRPDLIATLAEPWPFDEFGKHGGPGYTLRPLLHYQPASNDAPERMILQYARRSFTGYWGLPRSSNIPPITEAQAEALDAIHYLAGKHAVALDFHPGDIQFVNNLSIMHARGGFTDSPQKKRHLIRFWLRDEELAWNTPDVLRDRWDRVYKDVQADRQVFPLEPVIRGPSRGTENGVRGGA